jgi:hypothetical protein
MRLKFLMKLTPGADTQRRKKLFQKVCHQFGYLKDIEGEKVGTKNVEF